MPTNRPDYQVPYYKVWYQQNKAAHKIAVAARKQRALAETQMAYWNYLQEHPCVQCDEDDPIVLDADHISGKKRQSISLMIARGCCWKTINEELKKCQILCANCHRRETARRGTFWRHLVGRKH